MEELGRSPNFRRGSGKCFKMLFTREEYECRSLSGGKSNTGEQRLAIEDKKKCDFLEGTFILLSGLHLYGGKAMDVFTACPDNVNPLSN